MTSPHDQIIANVLASLSEALTEFGDTIRPINDNVLTTPLHELGMDFEQLLAALSADPKPIANEVATIRSQVKRTMMPLVDPALGAASYDRRTARGALAVFHDAASDALKVLESIGVQPDTPELLNPDEARVPIMALEQQLAAIADRLEIVAADVAGLKRDETGADRTPQQRGLLNFYIGQMEPRIALVNTEVSGQVIDLAALARLTEFLANTTRSFAATVAGMVSTASAGLKAAAPRLRAGVTAFVSSVRAGAQVARGWLARRRPPDMPLVQPDPPFDMDEVKRRILAGEAIPASWVPHVQELNFLDGELADLAPLANLIALTSLDVRNAQISELAPLAGLTALTSLTLWETQVSDLAPLAGLSALTSLSLSSPHVSDISPFASLTALTALNLGGCRRVSDLAPLAGLTALTSLYLMITPIRNLVPLAGLTALTSLDLRHTLVSDLTPLSGLKALTSLNLNSTMLSDSTAMITHGYGIRSHGSDLSPIAGLTALTSLDLSGARVSELDPLAGLTALTSLDLSGTHVSDLAQLAGLTSLTSLNLMSTQVSDLTPLAHLTALTSLDIMATQISDLAPVRGLPNLRQLRLGEPPPRLAQEWPGWRWDGAKNLLIHIGHFPTQRGLSLPV